MNLLQKISQQIEESEEIRKGNLSSVLGKEELVRCSGGEYGRGGHFVKESDMRGALCKECVNEI